VKRISEIVEFDFSIFIFLHSHNLLIFSFFWKDSKVSRTKW
jgi:hypothetical protein